MNFLCGVYCSAKCCYKNKATVFRVTLLSGFALNEDIWLKLLATICFSMLLHSLLVHSDASHTGFAHTGNFKVTSTYLILSGTRWVWLPSLWQLPAYCARLETPWSFRRAIAPWVRTETPLAIRLQDQQENNVRKRHWSLMIGCWGTAQVQARIEIVQGKKL